MSGQDWLGKDFYATLGVPKDADAAAIKKAYRKLARTYHPDKNPGDAAAESAFKEVGEAHDVLSDPEKRQQYDALRAMAGGGPRFASGPGGAAGSGAGGAGFEDLFGGMFGDGGQRVRYSTGGRGAGPGGAGGPDLEDLLSGMFGGGAGRRGAPAGFGNDKGADRSVSATLTFRQSVGGQTLDLVVGERRTKVRVPAGVKDGQKIRIAGKGQPGIGGGPAGDLIVTVAVQPHPVFGIDGKNLTITVPVTFVEAARGAVVQVPTLEGEAVNVKVPAGSSSGSRLRVKGRGVETKTGTGDLIVTIEVAVPRNLSGKALQALDAFADATAGEDPRVGLAQEASV